LLVVANLRNVFVEMSDEEAAVTPVKKAAKRSKSKPKVLWAVI